MPLARIIPIRIGLKIMFLEGEVAHSIVVMDTAPQSKAVVVFVPPVVAAFA